MIPSWWPHSKPYAIEDCLQGMKGLPPNKFHTCVTSPPYWGLRDYGTATWEGGDSKCDHIPNSLSDPKGDWERPSRKESSKVGATLKCVVCGETFYGKIGTKFCSLDCLNTLSNEERTNAISIINNICPKCGAVRVDKQFGLEETIEEYVQKMVEVFHEVKRVLRDDGTLWLNMGDCYNGSGNPAGCRGKRCDGGQQRVFDASDNLGFRGKGIDVSDLKPKDMVGMPWRVAFALQADGWYLRSDIIWAKPNPMPESVTDRPTKSHEYIFLLAKSSKYYYDADAIREPMKQVSIDRVNQPNFENQHGGPKDPRNGGEGSRNRSCRQGLENLKNAIERGQGRNKRDVWTIATKPYKKAHFATFPPDLIEPCILAGCPKGGIVLDPFLGSGTVSEVARLNDRLCLGYELNPNYKVMIIERSMEECPIIGLNDDIW